MQMNWLTDMPEPCARSTDPETSHMAAKRVAVKANTDRWCVLQSLSKLQGTDYDLAHRLGGQQNSLGKRRSELTQAGYVEWAGCHAHSPAGAACRVWRITDAGREVLRQCQEK